MRKKSSHILRMRRKTCLERENLQPKDELRFAIDEESRSDRKQAHSCGKKNPREIYNLVNKRTYRSLYKMEIHFALLEKNLRSLEVDKCIAEIKEGKEK